MQLSVIDWVVFLYNFGVVVSGSYVVMTFGIDDRVAFFAVMIVFALFWTIYFRYAMYSRLETLTEKAETTDR